MTRSNNTHREERLHASRSASPGRFALRIRTAGVLTALAVTAATLVGVSPAALAQAKPKVTEPKDLPALPSWPPAKVVPEALKGDFADAPPHPDQLGDPNRPTKSSFDPAKSTLIASETTPTKLTYANPDGTRTDVITAAPTRFKDAKGAWVDIDLALAPAANGALRAKSAERSPTVAAKADGVTTIDVAGGTIELRHPGAAAVPATIDKGAATYAKALGRRDLRVELVTGGVETFVVLPDAGAGATYVTELTLPAGFSARDATVGVEFLDGAGTVVATMANGWATDAHQPIPALAPVSVNLLAPAATPAPAGGAPATTAAPTTTVVSAGPTTGASTPTTTTPTAAPTTTVPARTSTTVRVEAGVEPAWLADPARVFPVTIDPSLTATVASPARDTMVFNGANANVNLGTNPELWVAVDGATLVRSYLYFDLPAAVVGKWVNNASLGLTTTAANCSAASPPALQVGAPREAWAENTLTWNNQANASAPLDPDAGTTTPAPPCSLGKVSLDATWLVWKWAKNVEANYGMVIRDAAESTGTPPRSRQFASNNAATAANKPTLTISYGAGSPAPEAPAVGPAQGEVISTTTPTLTVNKVSDNEGDPVRYWFRGTPGPDAETGARVINSGWISPGDPAFPGCPAGGPGTPCAFTVPPGVLHDGMSYSWHTWTWDSHSDWVMPAWVRTFTVDLHLGADELPTDSYGPVQVNLASGNLTTTVPTPTFPAVGGPVGVSLTYNSAAPPSTAGLVGSYYAWNGVGGVPAATTPPAMARTDPTLDFEWNGTPPAPVLPASNYFVRWEGDVTVPEAGAYRFGASAKDGFRLWIGGVLVVVGDFDAAAARAKIEAAFGGLRHLRADLRFGLDFQFAQLRTQPRDVFRQWFVAGDHAGLGALQRRTDPPRSAGAFGTPRLDAEAGSVDPAREPHPHRLSARPVDGSRRVRRCRAARLGHCPDDRRRAGRLRADVDARSGLPRGRGAPRPHVHAGGLAVSAVRWTLGCVPPAGARHPPPRGCVPLPGAARRRDAGGGDAVSTADPRRSELLCPRYAP